MVLLTVVLLGTGSSWLVQPIGGKDGVPLGTVLTWLAFICFPLVFLLSLPALIRPKTRLQAWIRKAFWALFILGVLWGLLSFALAANWSFNFKQQDAFRGSARAGVLFWYFNYLLGIVPIMLLAFLAFEALIHKLRKRT